MTPAGASAHFSGGDLLSPSPPAKCLGIAAPSAKAGLPSDQKALALGPCYEFLGQTEAALKHYQEALKDQPEEALVLKWLKDAAMFYRDSNIEMVLRAPSDEELSDSNLVVNFNYMREKYNLAPPPGVPIAGR